MDRFRFAYVPLIILLSVCVFSGTARAADLVTESEQAWLDENAHNVYYAPVKDYPPFAWSQYGVMFGIVIDYLNYIQEKLSVNFPRREPRSQKEIIEGIKSGESSFMGSIATTSEREEYFLFTRPYISLPTVYIGKSGAKAKTSQEIIEDGWRVSVSEDYGVHTYLKERYPEMQLVPVDNNYFVIQNVVTGVTEVGVINVATLLHLVREHNISNLKKLGETGFVSNFVFGVPKTMPELRNAFDNIIEAMPKNTRDAIISRWISDTTAIENIAGASVDIPKPASNENTYLVGMAALLLLCLGFILHYIFVRYTPRRDPAGHTEYVP